MDTLDFQRLEVFSLVGLFLEYPRNEQKRHDPEDSENISFLCKHHYEEN